MKGLILAQHYFEAIGRPAFQQALPDLYPRLTFGLAGEGSDCFGFDDPRSQDHDWGPAFCIWMNQSDFDADGQRVQSVYDSLPKTFKGFRRIDTPEGCHRVGALCLESWLTRYTGLARLPETLSEWRRIPLPFLATATNGSVFEDGPGTFTAIRETLIQGYPEDLWRRHIVHNAAIMAQAGQYNLPRCLHRGDTVATTLALNRFIEGGLTMVYALNRRYPPYYKWLHRGTRNLPILPRAYDLFGDLVTVVAEDQSTIIERLCRLIIGELKRQHLSNATSSFLLDHCDPIAATIQDPTLRQRPPMEV